MASSANQHCANCIGTLSFPIRSFPLLRIPPRYHFHLTTPFSSPRPTTNKVVSCMMLYTGDSDVVSFHIYASWFSPPSCG